RCPRLGMTKARAKKGSVHSIGVTQESTNFCRALGPLALLKRSALSLRPDDDKMYPEDELPNHHRGDLNGPRCLCHSGADVSNGNKTRPQSLLCTITAATGEAAQEALARAI